MKKFRITKNYYRGREAKVMHNFKVEELKKRFSLFGKTKLKWKPVQEHVGYGGDSWWEDKTFSDFETAFLFMRNITSEVPGNEVVYENN